MKTATCSCGKEAALHREACAPARWRSSITCIWCGAHECAEANTPDRADQDAKLLWERRTTQQVTS